MTIPATLSSVPDTLPYQQYIATLNQTVFPYPFPITQDADLVVVINGVTQVTDSTYSVSGVGNPTGGNVTRNVGSTAGDIVTLFRDIDIKRLTQIGQNSGFSSTAFNAEFNNIYLIMQQLQESIGFCLQVPNTNTPLPTTTLLPTLYANAFLGFDSHGNPTPSAMTTTAISAAIIMQFFYPKTQAETNANITPQPYPYDDIRRYGLIANDVSKAAANATALQALFNPAIVNGPSGTFKFINTGAAATPDVYYIGGQFPIRPGCKLDLCGSTLNFRKALTSGDNLQAFMMAIYDVIVENGNIAVNILSGTGLTNAGIAILLGSRSGYAFGTLYPTGVFDYDTLTSQGLPYQGNMTLRNIRISTNNPASNAGEAVLLFGGLRNVVLENVYVNGQGVAGGGIYYEFGWAKANGSGTSSNWTSSHAENMVWRNPHCENFSVAGNGSAIGAHGAHGLIIEGAIVDTAVVGIDLAIGEALNYRTWTPTDSEARVNIIRGVTLTGITSNGINLLGAESNTGGYLSGVQVYPSQMQDLMTYVVDGFNITAGGFSIFAGGDSDIRNGRADGAAASGSICVSDDVANFLIEKVRTTGSGGAGFRCTFPSVAKAPTTVTAGNASIACNNNFTTGMPVKFSGSFASVTGLTAGTIYYVIAAGLSGTTLQVSATLGGSAITPGGSSTATPSISPARLKQGRISSSFAGGNAGQGFLFDNCSSIRVENSCSGYSLARDNQVETTQTSAFLVTYGTNGGGVVFDGCEAHTASGNAYVSTGTVVVGNTLCGISNAKGETTVSGVYEVNGIASATTTNINDKTNTINTCGKFLGRTVYNTTTTKLVVAQGSTATSTWISVDAATTYTPS